MEAIETKKLTPERVVEILKKKGTVVDIREAEIMLKFIKKIAHISVNQYISGRIK